jgi:hypothetical protein
MTDNAKEENDADDVEELTVKANRARARLLETVDAIDRKRHDALNLNLQLRKHAEPIAIGGGAIFLAVAGGVGLIAYQMATRSERLRHERFSMLRRLWIHPERAARREPRSFLGQLARNVVLGLLSTAILFPARHLLTHVASGERQRREGH